MSEIRKLEERIAFLEAENAYLRSLFGDEIEMPREWRLSPQQARFVRALLILRDTRRGNLLTYIHDGHEEDREVNLINVLVYNVRRKLAPFGIAIENQWGQGYSLSPQSRAEAERQIKAANPNLPAYFRTVA